MLCFNHRFKFKALELNRKILEGAEGIKRPTVKEPTVPEGFELQIEKRLQERQASKPQEDEEKPHTFKSQPLPKKILEGVVVSWVQFQMLFECCREWEAFEVTSI